ncbi:MAG: P-loop NTPase fold protein, partial [Micrococcales bacterium]|nr:P-loop NTPase fold protein [Micrococcales bacterium]
AVAIGRLGEREVIASASSDHTIRLWDATGHLIGGPLTGHTGGVNAVAVSPGGDTIVAAGDDGILWLYDALSDWPVEETDDLLKSTPTVIASVTSDDASEEDLLGVTPEVERLSALICARATSAPLSVALLGDWGSGKSSFMLQMKRRVARLAEASRDSSPDNAFVGNVRQAWFNAWHYSDDTVWVGMVEQLFRALAIDPHASDPDPDSERPHQIRKRLTDIRAERSKIEADLSARQSTNSKIGPKVRSYANQAFRSLKKHWFGLGILPTILILAGLALWQGFGKDLTGWTITATVGAWVSALLVRAARAFRRTKEALEAADEKMRDRDNNLASEEQNLQEALVKADAIVGLTRFVNQGVGDDITKYRGIVAEVHQQLQELDRRITNAGRQLPELLGGERPIERVILYVDDLDRCPPQKVVDVLAAVDLLLSLPLFVGVVGVDARWLRRSLQHHEQTLFPEAEHAGDLPLEEVRDPLDYLDKIFQIPYSLRKPRPETVREYVGTLLLPRSGQETGLAEDTVPAPAPSEVLADTQDPVDDPPATSARSPGHGSESTKEAQRARTVASRASERSPINLRPENLTISSHEIDYLGSVGAHLLSTPRAAKKLVNLYRLVRCGVSPAELSTFADSSDAEPYRATALLLGVLVGCPRLAARVFPEIGSANPDLDLSTLIRATVHGGVGKTEHSLAHDALSDCPMCIAALQLDTALGSMRPLPGYPTKVGAYKRWALEVSHLSFHTAPLLQRRRAVRGPLGLELR